MGVTEDDDLGGGFFGDALKISGASVGIDIRHLIPGRGVGEQDAAIVPLEAQTERKLTQISDGVVGEGLVAELPGMETEFFLIPILAPLRIMGGSRTAERVIVVALYAGNILRLDQL